MVAPTTDAPVNQVRVNVEAKVPTILRSGNTKRDEETLREQNADRQFLEDCQSAIVSQLGLNCYFTF